MKLEGRLVKTLVAELLKEDVGVALLDGGFPPLIDPF